MIFDQNPMSHICRSDETYAQNPIYHICRSYKMFNQNPIYQSRRFCEIFDQNPISHSCHFVFFSSYLLACLPCNLFCLFFPISRCPVVLMSHCLADLFVDQISRCAIIPLSCYPVVLLSRCPNYCTFSFCEYLPYKSGEVIPDQFGHINMVGYWISVV